MCDSGCIEFGERTITEDDVREKDVLEVGARDLNGSLRDHVASLGPNFYVGVDIQQGIGVDKIVNAKNLCREFGEKRFDLVITTEMLEHVENWQDVVSELKRVLRPGGTLIITTRSKGTPLHDYPGDFWRFEIGDMMRIFSDMVITHLEIDPTNLTDLPGVMMRAEKPLAFNENDLSTYKLYSMKEDHAIA